MSITDELRHNIEGAEQLYGCECKHLLAIADRIDEEHQKAMSRAGQLLADAEKDRDYNYANWQECKQKVLQHNITFDELNAKIERLKDELAHRIEPPKDADGEYTNADDEMFWKEDGDSAGRVTAIGVGQRAGWVWTLPDGCLVSIGHEAFRLRHHHAPTVEDVLLDACKAYHSLMVESMSDVAHDMPAPSEIIAEYAAKLRLAEGEDA